jgi:hypothetical protein
MANTENTALAKVEEYAVVKAGATGIQELIQENLGTDSIDIYQLDQVKMPSGGSTTWIVPSIEGDKDERVIEGVIAYWHLDKAFWRERMEESGGGSAPDCRGVLVDQGNFKVWHGVGDPGIFCDGCPMNVFPEGGGRKPCKDMARLYVLRPGDVMPLVITLSPASIKPLQQYMRRLTTNGMQYWTVVTKLALNRTENKGGIKYAEFAPTYAGQASVDARPTLTAYKNMLKASVDAKQEQLRAILRGDVQPESADSASAPISDDDLEAPIEYTVEDGDGDAFVNE